MKLTIPTLSALRNSAVDNSAWLMVAAVVVVMFAFSAHVALAFYGK